MRWFFEDGSASDLAYSDKVLDAIKSRTAVVPATWGLEAANVLARAEMRFSVEPTRISDFVNMLGTLGIEVDEGTFEHSLSDTLRLARAYKLSAYDASYLEVALRLNISLATLDENLRKAAKKAGVKKFLE